MQQDSCDGCDKPLTMSTKQCENKACPRSHKYVLPPFDPDFKYMRVNDTVFPVPNEHFIQKDGEVMFLDCVVPNLMNGQTVYRPITAGYFARRAMTDIKELKKTKKKDEAEKEEMKKQMQVLNERVTFWKKLAEASATSLSQKTEELLESQKAFSAYRLESEVKMKSAEEMQMKVEKKLLKTEDRLETQKKASEKSESDLYQRIFELGKNAEKMEQMEVKMSETTHALKTTQEELGKKSTGLEEARATIQELRDDNGQLRIALSVYEEPNLTLVERVRMKLAEARQKDEQKRIEEEKLENELTMDETDWGHEESRATLSMVEEEASEGTSSDGWTASGNGMEAEGASSSSA